MPCGGRGNRRNGTLLASVGPPALNRAALGHATGSRFGGSGRTPEGQMLGCRGRGGHVPERHRSSRTTQKGPLGPRRRPALSLQPNQQEECPFRVRHPATAAQHLVNPLPRQPEEARERRLLAPASRELSPDRARERVPQRRSRSRPQARATGRPALSAVFANAFADCAGRRIRDSECEIEKHLKLGVESEFGHGGRSWGARQAQLRPPPL